MKVGDIIRATSGVLIAGDPLTKIGHADLTTDSRAVKKGQVFIALKGPRYDGHRFADEAIRRGALGVICSQKRSSYPGKRTIVIRVGDTLAAYGAIAALHRSKFDIPVIAVTGSSGKTTVKEMIASTLSRKFTVLANALTENNYVGVPKTLLKLDESYRVCIVELGMNHPGEIDYLSRLVRPSMGVITNIGPAHLEYMGSLKNIFRAKCELLGNLPRRGMAVLNGDDVFLRSIKSDRFETVTYGFGSRCDVRATDAGYRNGRWYFTVNGSHRFELPLAGRYHISNALAAIATGIRFGVSFSAMKDALCAFRQLPMRMAVRTVGGVTVIDDSYNANPLSMRCAIETLEAFDTAGRRMVVAGDMAELGARSRSFHREIGVIIARSNIEYLLTMGSRARETGRAAKDRGMPKDRVFFCKTHAEIAGRLKGLTRRGDVVLFKGSRTMKMEEALSCYTTCAIR